MELGNRFIRVASEVFGSIVTRMSTQISGELLVRARQYS